MTLRTKAVGLHGGFIHASFLHDIKHADADKHLIKCFSSVNSVSLWRGINFG